MKDIIKRLEKLEQKLASPIKITVEIVDDDYKPDEAAIRSGKVIFIRLEETGGEE
jgi:hypothetical protein